MIRFFGVLAVFCFFLASCSGMDTEKDWYLQGGDVHLALDWKENRILMEDSTDTIFSGIILSKEDKEGMTQIRARLDNVNSKFAYRYPEESRKDFIIWLKWPQKGVLKVTISQLSPDPYTFLSHPTIETFVPYKQGRFLSESEMQDFFKDTAYGNIATRFATSVVSNREPLFSPEDVSKNEATGYRRWLREKYLVSNALSFYQMTDYLQDLDPSTAFITKTGAENLRLEYIINQRGDDIPVPLKNPAPIRAVYIVAGNLDNPWDFRRYRQAKSLTISFTTKNSGGLGGTMANYNEKSIRILLANQKKIHLVYFYQPIFAKNISVHVDSYYMGDRDAMAIFDLAFFSGNA